MTWEYPHWTLQITVLGYLTTALKRIGCRYWGNCCSCKRKSHLYIIAIALGDEWCIIDIFIEMELFSPRIPSTTHSWTFSLFARWLSLADRLVLLKLELLSSIPGLFIITAVDVATPLLFQHVFWHEMYDSTWPLGRELKSTFKGELVKLNGRNLPRWEVGGITGGLIQNG